MSDVTLSAMPPPPKGCQLPRRRISEMAAGDSKNQALEWQPRFLRPKALRHGTESRRHRTWRKRFRRWWPGDSENAGHCGGLAPPFEGAAASRGDSFFGGGSQRDSKNAANYGSPASPLLRSFAPKRRHPSPRKGGALSPREPAATCGREMFF